MKYIYSDGMTAKITRTSDYGDGERYIKNFGSLEELMEFIQDRGKCVIFPPKDKRWAAIDPDYKLWEIEIYDDWRE